MSKNLLKKGLAIGAAISLGVSAFIALPAQGAITGTTKVTIEEDSGNGFIVLSANSAAFVLTSTVANSLRGAATDGLKWLVTDPDSLLTPDVDDGSGFGAGSIGTREADGSRVVDALDYTAELLLEMGTAPTTASYSSTVTAWYDDNNNDVVDTDEYAASQTVTWALASTVSSSVVVTSPIIGDTSFEGYVVTSPVLNYDQSTAPTVKFTFQGNTQDHTATVSKDATNERFKFVAKREYAISAGTISAPNVALGSADHKLEVSEVITTSGLTGAGGTTAGMNGTKTVSAIDMAATPDTFTVAAGGATGAVTPSSAKAIVPVIAGTYTVTPSVGSKAGTTSSFGVSVPVADDGTASVTSGANVKVSGNASASVTATVRPDTKTVTGTFAFVDADDVALPAGKPVRITVGITSATGVKVNGVTKTAGQTLDVVTAAGGLVDVTVTTTSAAASDQVVLTAVAEAVGTSSTVITYNWTAVSLSFYDLGDAGSSVIRSMAVGGSHTFSFAITDNWAVAPSGDFRLKVAVSGNTVSETYPVMTAGRASVSITDAQIATGNITAVVTPQKKQTDGTWATTGAPSAVTYTLIPRAQTGAELTATVTDSPKAANTATLVAGDERTSQLNVTDAAEGNVDIGGVVRTATTSAARPGARVTVSGPSSILFIKGNTASYGSISFFADATTGAYNVQMTSNVSQTDSVITIASEGGTKTAKVTFNAALETAGSAITSNAPTSIKGGRTFSVTLTLKDKFGNLVNGGDTTDSGLAIAYDGPGFVTNDIDAVTELGSDGSYSVRVLTSAGDTGVATFTLSYSPSGVITAASTDVISETFAVWVGPIANAKAGAKKGRVIVEAYRAKGKTVSVYVGSTRVASFVSDEANFSKVVRGIKSGTRNVSVRLSGPGEDFTGAITVK